MSSSSAAALANGPWRANEARVLDDTLKDAERGTRALSLDR